MLAWFVVLVSWYAVRCCVVRGSWYAVRCSVFVVSGSWYAVRCSVFVARVSWLVFRGSCFVVLGSCFVVRGSCFVVRGTRFGVWHAGVRVRVVRRSVILSIMCPIGKNINLYKLPVICSNSPDVQSSVLTMVRTFVNLYSVLMCRLRPC